MLESFRLIGINNIIQKFNKENNIDRNDNNIEEKNCFVTGNDDDIRKIYKKRYNLY